MEIITRIYIARGKHAVPMLQQREIHTDSDTGAEYLSDWKDVPTICAYEDLNMNVQKNECVVSKTELRLLRRIAGTSNDVYTAKHWPKYLHAHGDGKVAYDMAVRNYREWLAENRRKLWNG
jgi:hypothetical protein